MTSALPALLESSLPAKASSSDPWVIVDQMIGGSLYRTHYFCRFCWADLTDLRVHHIICCPYCATDLPFLLDGQDRPHVSWMQAWPYDALRERFPTWCSWYGIGDAPQVPTADGGYSQAMDRCRLLEGHGGDHIFTGGRQRPPRNPFGTDR